MEEIREFEAEGTGPEAAAGEKELSKYVPEAQRKPGELGIAALGFFLGAFGYYFALDMTSGEYSSPSVFPKLASTLSWHARHQFFKAVRRENPKSLTSGIFSH